MVEKPLADNMIQMIIALFKQAGKVTENGLIAFNGMVVGLGDKVDLSNIGHYIKFALESKENDCTKIACGIISDLSERMDQYLDDFVPCLHQILSDETLDRKIKLPALHALGELCLNCGATFNQRYLDKTMTMMNLAGRASIQTTQYVNDAETLEFLKELREAIIDQYIIILMSAEDSGFLEAFGVYLETIFDFLETTAKIEDASSTNTIRLILSLVGDLAKAFPGHQGVKQKATMPYIEQGILMLQQQNDAESKQQANYTLEAVKSMTA